MAKYIGIEFYGKWCLAVCSCDRSVALHCAHVRYSFCIATRRLRHSDKECFRWGTGASAVKVSVCYCNLL